MLSHWSLSDSKSSQVTRTLRSILADLSNEIFWMVSIRPFISKSSTYFINPSVTVTRASITIVIIVMFMFYSFFNSQAWSRYLCFFSLFFSILLDGQLGEQSPRFCKFSFSCWLLLGLVVWPRLGDPFVSQNLREVCASHSSGQILGCAHTICSYGQIWISCTVPTGSPCQLSRV